jgi:hypothetical protein
MQFHQVPEDRPFADRNHRLRDAFGHVPNARAEAAAEQNCFHLTAAFSRVCRVPACTHLNAVSRINKERTISQRVVIAPEAN